MLDNLEMILSLHEYFDILIYTMNFTEIQAHEGEVLYGEMVFLGGGRQLTGLTRMLTRLSLLKCLY